MRIEEIESRNQEKNTPSPESTFFFPLKKREDKEKREKQRYIKRNREKKRSDKTETKKKQQQESKE